jgi:hypothetical protein
MIAEASAANSADAAMKLPAPGPSQNPAELISGGSAPHAPAGIG